MSKPRVLFVCTHNSARSQMAEGLLHHFAPDQFEALSAGTEVSSVRPEAIKVMAEIGIDISSQQSKSVQGFIGQEFAWVVTVCDRARETCPVFPGSARAAHWDFDDPSAAKGSEEQRLQVFRRVRDEIRDRVRMFIPDADNAATTVVPRRSQSR